MTVKNVFHPKTYSQSISGALLVLRVVVGLAFVLHGTGKIQHPFGWMPPEAGIPGIFQFLAAVSEFFGGIFLVVGLLTPLAALGIFFTMTVAVISHGFMRHDPFVSQGGGPSFEIALVYWAITLVLMTAGPGAFSLDAVIFKKKSSH
jgi:putative oxidoreductase